VQLLNLQQTELLTYITANMNSRHDLQHGDSG